MKFSFSYPAYFICSHFNVQLLSRVIPEAEDIYNNLPRKMGHRKHIGVTINNTKKCLDFVLDSEIDLDPVNYLRSAQYFSKVLSTQQGMNNYIVDGRLLVQ